MVRGEARGEVALVESGRYAVYEPIAAGGMASVHLGRLCGPVGFSRIVAVKRMHQRYAMDPEFVAMFLDEARLVARIKHPNVMPTLDIVANEREVSLVMEYVHGESLSRLLKNARIDNAPVPLGIVCAIMSASLHGLHAAHEATSERGEPLGLVHRDVSPQNILVGVDGIARVLDFGIAKAAGRSQETKEGVLKGKIAYMAPEQLHGAPATRQTDIYAAGVVLWEMLSGERFHDAESDVSLIVQVMEGRLVPPSSSRWGVSKERALEGRIKNALLDEIAMRALAPNPADRYATAREMALALERALALATPSEVGEWVEAMGSKGLAERAARVREIESQATEDRPSGIPSVAKAAAATAAVTAPARPEEDAPTRVEAARRALRDHEASVTPPPMSIAHIEEEIARFRPMRRRRFAAIAGGLTLALAGLVVLGTRSEPIAAARADVPTTAAAVAAAPTTHVEEIVTPDAGAPVTVAAPKRERPAPAAAPRVHKKADLDIRLER